MNKYNNKFLDEKKNTGEIKINVSSISANMYFPSDTQTKSYFISANDVVFHNVTILISFKL